jgi:hypothetical protein
MADPVEREQLFGLCSEASLLARCWRLHIQLYGNGQHVELMREAAIRSFGLFQKVLQDSIVLSCQRLLDPASSRGNTTASIEALIQMIDPADARRRFASRTGAAWPSVSRTVRQSRWPPEQSDHSNSQVNGPHHEQRPEAPRVRERRGEPFHGNEDGRHNRHLGR